MTLSWSSPIVSISLYCTVQFEQQITEDPDPLWTYNQIALSQWPKKQKSAFLKAQNVMGSILSMKKLDFQ